MSEMSEQSILSGWVKEMNKSLGTAFSLGENGRLALAFENGVRAGVEVEEGGSHYTIYTPLLLLNSAKDLSVIMKALSLNLYQHETAGGVIGLDPDYGTLIYSFRFPVSQSGAQILARQLNEFVVVALRLTQILKETQEDEAQAIDWTKTDLVNLADLEDPDNRESPGEESLNSPEEDPLYLSLRRV